MVNYWNKIFFIINQKKQFFLSFLFYFIFVVFLLLVIGNEEFSLLSNSISSPILDFFFYFITYLGDGLFAAIFLIFFMVIRLNIGFVSLFSLLIPGLLTQFLKRFCFPDLPRPSVVFKSFIDSGNWHLVDGVELHSYFSFPSGHTTTIFSICCLSVLLIKNKFYQFTLFLLVILTGFSRIYLSQHFLIDVLTGSIIGCLGTLLVYVICNGYFNKIKWMSFSLYELILQKFSKN